MTSPTLEHRIQRLEDRNAIIDLVISYAMSIDRGDWESYASIFTEEVHIDFSEAGMPAALLPRDVFVGFAKDGLEAWDARQHISPNHVVVFDADDPDGAMCTSYMYAQHYKADESGGRMYLMRGWYDNRVVRTTDGWKISGVTQHISWTEGDPKAASVGSRS